MKTALKIAVIGILALLISGFDTGQLRKMSMHSAEELTKMDIWQIWNCLTMEPTMN